MSAQPRDGTAVVTGRSEFEGMAAEWDVLAKSVGLPMLSHAWILSCVRNLLDDDRLHVITVRVGGSLVGAAPLVTRDHAGITRLELLGVADLYEPSGLLYDTDETLGVLLRAIVDTRQPVLLSRIPTASPIASQLRSVVRRPGVMLVKPGAGTLAVPIALPWSEFLEHTSARHRYDLRRARRRAEESGTVTARISRPRPADVAELFAELVRIEATGWKASRGSSLQQRPALRRFFLDYATLAADKEMVQFGFLDVNGRPIAAQLSVVYADRHWVLKIGYDEAWRRCSPGSLLLTETMRDAFDRKLKAYEFLGVDEPWLHRWDTEATSYSTAAWYPPSVLGWYGLLADTSGRVMVKAASVLTKLTGF